MTSMRGLLVGDFVHDRWYPYKRGKIVKVLKTRIHIMWIGDGEIEVYDNAHQQFLVKE